MKKKAIIIFILLLIIIVSPEIQCVSGKSMQPTLHDGELLVVSKYITPKDGDIVIIDTSKVPNYEQDSEHIIKRYYEALSTDGYYVLGDNASCSYDSRYFGEIPKEAVEGVVLYHFH